MLRRKVREDDVPTSRSVSSLDSNRLERDLQLARPLCALGLKLGRLRFCARRERVCRVRGHRSCDYIMNQAYLDARGPGVPNPRGNGRHTCTETG